MTEQQEFDERRAERRAEMRVRLGLSLSYEDLEILSGIPRSTLAGWKVAGRIKALPDSMGRSPRFSVEELRRIMGLDGNDKQQKSEAGTAKQQPSSPERPVPRRSPVIGSSDADSSDADALSDLFGEVES